MLGGRDLCGIAQTGTVKTAAFALPILQRLAAAKQRTAPQTWRALVLSPTRELASQIAASFRAYGAGIPLSTAVVFGGVPIGPQRQNLAHGVDILVATPGRLLDLIDMHRGRFVSGLSAPPVADQTRLGRSPRATPRPFTRPSIRWHSLSIQRRARDMLIARDGETIVFPKGYNLRPHDARRE